MATRYYLPFEWQKIPDVPARVMIAKVTLKVHKNKNGCRQKVKYREYAIYVFLRMISIGLNIFHVSFAWNKQDVIQKSKDGKWHKDKVGSCRSLMDCRLINSAKAKIRATRSALF